MELIGVLFVLVFTVHDVSARKVSLSLGALEGQTIQLEDPAQDVDVFLGVPYAQPPVGEMRFRRPQPVRPWRHTMKATKLPNSCWQTHDESFDRFPGVDMWNPNTQMNEDCLYLNIWAPAPQPSRTTPNPDGDNNKGLAVMVWIYGGGFSSGTSTLDIYDGKYWAAYGNVVFVSMQYRVGAMGFLYTGKSFAPGNMGLLDQNVALQWIMTHIAEFGGDPSRVMLFGESAGSASVSAHWLSPMSQPLIARAALQSGMITADWALDDNDEAIHKAKQLAALVGCSNEDDMAMVKCMRQVPATKVTEAQWKVTGGTDVTGTVFVPVVDGKFLPDHPKNIIKEKRFKKSNILVGTTLNEGTYFLSYHLPDLFSFNSTRPLVRTEFIDSIQKVLNVSSVLAEAVGFEYGEPYELSHSVDYRASVDQITGDFLFTCSLTELAFATAQQGVGVYQYLFAHRSSKNPWPAWMGVMHAYELDIQFGMPLNNTAKYSDDEVNLAKIMIKYWSNFAKTGNPNRGDPGDDGSIPLTMWPDYTTSNREYLVLNTDVPTVRHGLNSRKCAFWNKVYPKLAEYVSKCEASSAWGSGVISTTLLWSSLLAALSTRS